VNEAIQNLPAGGLVIRDGFAAILAWGWDSTQNTILGIPVHADMNNAIPVIPSGSQIMPSACSEESVEHVEILAE